MFLDVNRKSAHFHVKNYKLEVFSLTISSAVQRCSHYLLLAVFVLLAFPAEERKS